MSKMILLLWLDTFACVIIFLTFYQNQDQIELQGYKQVRRFNHKLFLILFISQICAKPTYRLKGRPILMIEKTKYGNTSFVPTLQRQCYILNLKYIDFFYLHSCFCLSLTYDQKQKPPSLNIWLLNDFCSVPLRSCLWMRSRSSCVVLCVICLSEPVWLFAFHLLLRCLLLAFSWEST